MLWNWTPGTALSDSTLCSNLQNNQLQYWGGDRLAREKNKPWQPWEWGDSLLALASFVFFCRKHQCWRQQTNNVAACPNPSADPWRVSFEWRNFPFKNMAMPRQLGPTLLIVKPINFLFAFGIDGYDPMISLPVEICWETGQASWDHLPFKILPVNSSPWPHHRITMQKGTCADTFTMDLLVCEKLERDQMCPLLGNG